MQKVRIVAIVLLVAAAVTLGCYWLWTVRTSGIGTNHGGSKETGPSVKDVEQQREIENQQKGSTKHDKTLNEVQNKEPRKENDNAMKIKTSQQAIDAAKVLLGWEEGKYSAEKITIKNCFVPFVRKKVNGKLGWKVLLSEITLRLKRPPPKEEYPYPIKLEAENPFVKEFECVILAETGQLLYIESKILEGVVIEPDRFTIEEAEKMYWMISERIIRFPDEPPRISFRTLLNRAFDEESVLVSKAKQIIAFYVVASRGEDGRIRPEQPWWLLHSRGFFPPVPLSSPKQLTGIPQKPPSINYMRMIFTAEGKQWGGDSMRAPK